MKDQKHTTPATINKDGYLQTTTCICSGYVLENHDGDYFVTDLFISDKGNYYHNKLVEITKEQFDSQAQYNRRDDERVQAGKGKIIFPLEAQTSLELGL